MDKTPAQFAEQLLNLYRGDHDAACTELFNASRVYDKVPCKFFFDTFNLIQADKAPKREVCFLKRANLSGVSCK